MSYYAYYVKDVSKKQYYINNYLSKNEFDRIIYFCPKKQAGQILLPKNSHTFFYEDVDKTNEPYTLASDRSLLILDNCSRYKNIMTRTFKRLVRIANGYTNKLMLDIVPFTTGIEYLYVPWAYMSRSVLQHQHWYAFRENNKEIDENGNVVEGHDFKLLSKKISNYCEIDYKQFFENKTEVINCKMTKEEHSGYMKIREGLFQRFDKYQPIITRLADYTNMAESRYLKMRDLISTLEGKTIIYTNIKSHNKELKKRFKMPVMTYYDNNGEEKEANNIILFEIPIVKGCLFLDVVANLKPDCNVYIFLSDSTSDKLLYKKMTDEYTSINEFTKTLWEVQNGRKKNI